MATVSTSQIASSVNFPFLHRIWFMLVEPTDFLKDDDRQKAKILSALILVFIPLALFTLMLSPITALLNGEEFVPPNAGYLIAIAIMCIAYALSRTKYYVIGAFLIISSITGSIFAVTVSAGTPVTPTALFFMSLSIFLSSLLLSVRGTLMSGFLVIMVVIVTYQLTQTTESEFPTSVITFMIVTTLIVSLVNYLKDKNLVQLQLTQNELERLNETLEQRVIERTKELKDARDQALTAQRIATENNRLKSEFLSTMSHELRTPLNAIEGFTSIMLSGMGIELNDRAEDMVKRVSSNSKRLLHLINDFLDLSRIESGRLELVQAPVYPHKLTEEWKTQVGVLAEEKNLTFHVQVSHDLPSMLLGDEDALTKIGINLLSNAFKFTQEGQVSLYMYCLDGDKWSIEVRDTGIGIPSHAREYIFDEFRQVDGSSKRLYGGTGLGLALVQKLTRAMGGSVILDSEVGKGSTFTVTLPLDLPKKDEQD